VSLDKLIK